MKELKKIVLIVSLAFSFSSANAQVAFQDLRLRTASPASASVLQLSALQAARMLTAAEAAAISVSCFQYNVTCSVVPVQLIDFTAIRAGDEAAALTWHAANESNMAGYYIERSLMPSAGFSTRGFTPATTGSAAAKEYHFNDPNNLTVTSYYRLRITNADGSFTYSEVRPVKPVKESAALLAYPSPAAAVLSLRITVPKRTTALIAWHDAAGKKVMEQSTTLQAGTNYLTENIATLAGGAYFITVATPDAAKMVTSFFKLER